MTRLEALEKAKENGYKKAILVPYTYHARPIDSHIREAQRRMTDPDYRGSCTEHDDCRCEMDGIYITCAGELAYILV